MKYTIADNALSKKRGRVIIGLLGKREHIVIVIPLKSPVLQFSKQKYSLEADTEIIRVQGEVNSLDTSNCEVNCLRV